MNLLIGILVSAILIVWCFPKKRFWRHQYNIGRANRALDTLCRIRYPGQQFAYLRKLDPFVFEELLLSAFERQGHIAIRNKRYTGDGGIDGKVVINKQPFLVQAKRYKGYIQASHVAEFALLCRQQKCSGLFIHTGKTGKTAYVAQCSTDIKIISGSRLLALLAPVDNASTLSKVAG